MLAISRYVALSAWIVLVGLQVAQAAAPVEEPPFEPPGDALLGLAGRISLSQGRDSVDPGFLVFYTPGKVLLQNTIEKSLGEQAKELVDKKAIRIELGGLLHVPRDMEVVVWHTGGSNAQGTVWLYIDGKVIGGVGQDKTKNTSYRVALKKGEHIVGWQLFGGKLGNSVVEFYDPESHARLTTYAPAPMVTTLNRTETKEQLDLAAAKPMPKQPPTLFGPVPAATATATGAKAK
jgi:hypothetical protein